MAILISESFKKDALSKNTQIAPIVLIEQFILEEMGAAPFGGERIYRYHGFSTNNLQLTDSITNQDIYFKPLLLGMPKLKESVDIETGKHRISSVTLNFSNLKYNGSRMSDLLNDDVLVNQIVSIYFKSQSCTTISPYSSNTSFEIQNSDCPLVYSGIIRSISHTDERFVIKLEDFTEQKIHKSLPLSDLESQDNVPNRYKNKPIPMIYGFLKNAPTVARYQDGKYSILFDYRNIVGSVTEQYYTGFYYDDDGQNLDEYLDIGGLKLFKGHYVSVMHNIMHRFVKSKRMPSEENEGFYTGNPDYVNIEIGERQITIPNSTSNFIQIENGGLFSANRIQCISRGTPYNISFKRLNHNGYAGQQEEEYISDDVLSNILKGETAQIEAESANLAFAGDNMNSNQDVLFGYRLSASFGVNGGKYNKLIKFTLNDYNLPIKNDVDFNISTSYAWASEVEHWFFGSDSQTDFATQSLLYRFFGDNDDGFWHLTDSEAYFDPIWDFDNYIPVEWFDSLQPRYDENGEEVINPFTFAPNSSEFPTTTTTFDDDDYEGLAIGHNFVFRPERLIKFITSVDDTEDIAHDDFTGNCLPAIRFHEGVNSFKYNRADISSYNIDFLKLYTLYTANGFELNSNVCKSKISMEIENITQASIVDIEDATDEEFYVDVKGRQIGNVSESFNNEEDYITNPIVIIRDILENELLVSEFDESEYQVACQEHQNYKFAFAVKDRIDSKKLIEEISENIQSYPRIKNNGKFGFVTIKQLYEQEDYENSKLIDNIDIITYNFKLTDINKLISGVKLEYGYDYASESFLREESRLNMNSQQLSLYQIASIPANLNTSNESQIDITDRDKIIQTKHTSDENTAKEIRDRTFYNSSAQHLIINMTLPLQYSELEVGSLIRFEKDKLISGLTTYGIDYTNPVKYGFAYRYPLFLIKEVQRGLNSIAISCYQLHKIFDVDSEHTDNHQFWNDTNFPNINLNDPTLDGLEDIDEGLGDVNLDGNLNVLDAVMLANYVLGNTDLDATQLLNADWNQDNNIDITDVVSLIQHILGNI